MLHGRKILLGITGSIAAYKTAILTRLLIKNGASVKVIMTPFAKEFITPLTLATLSKNPILVDFYNPENGDWNSHIDIGTWADLYVIAPATANTIAKMASGVADNLLLTTYLSARCPVIIAPAMDLDMFRHPATRKNIETLQKNGNIIIEPATGELASGLEGQGRMEEPETIFKQIVEYFSIKKELNKRILITAGPTHETIDPVRFIGNHSSGKMGYALAECIANKGAEVILISGPTHLNIHHSNIQLIRVTSADEMFRECLKHFITCDAAILAAAVADYTPAEKSHVKLKRNNGNLNIDLIPTKDIAAELGKIKKSSQVLAGFALETDHEIENATQKLKNKNFDFIVLNSLADKNSGFNTDTNKITIIDKNNNIQPFPLKGKDAAARDIMDKLISYF
jgi:phosphopantothenoylcysteine decarboxylase/phosphopantothenate--cysteine ligase